MGIQQEGWLYRQQNVRQRQKIISIIDYDVCMTFTASEVTTEGGIEMRLLLLLLLLLDRHCNYSSILYYLRVI